MRKTASDGVPAWGAAEFTSAGRGGACRPYETRLERRSVKPLGVLVRLFELGVDHAALLRLAGTAAGRAVRRARAGRRSRTGRAGCAGRFVELRRHGVRFLLEPRGDVLNLLVVVLLDRLAPFLDQPLDGSEIDAHELVAVVGDLAFERVAEVVELVAPLDLFAPAPILGLVLRGILDHAVDVLLAEAARRRDRDALILAGGEVLGGHREDAVRVDVERHLDLGHAARRRRDAFQVELAERAVVPSLGALALEHVDLD